MDIINTILSSSRTVFTTQWLAMMDSTRTRESLNNSLRYYARTGVLHSPRNGIYTKPTYNEQEMACALLKPSYISMEYVLARAGVTFQYSDEITCISNPIIWTNMQGIEQRDNIAIATPERAFLDMMYLSSGQCYFDNLHPLNKKKVQQLLPLYNSPTLTKRVEALLNGSK